MIDAFSRLSTWLQQHDVTIDLITVWALALGFGLFGLVKTVSWWVLKRQEDQTMVGVSLKRQKLGEFILGFGMATLYSMTLFAYYMQDPVFGFWDRLLLRTGLFISILLVSAYGIQFVYHLRRESRRGTTGSIPLARDVEEGR